MTRPILITNTALLTDSSATVVDNQWLLCRDKRIHSFGPMTDIPDTPEVILIDGTDKLLMPGLINAHNHCAMTLFRGLADDLELGEWLNEHIFPAEARHVNPEMVYECSKLAAAEMLLSGTTCVADGYFHETHTAQALCDAGMRAVPCQGIIDFPAPGVPDPAENIAAAEIFLQEWQGKDERINPGIFAHSPYTCSPETLTKAKQLAANYSVPFCIHAAETRQEQQLIIDPQDTSPIRHLFALNLLDKSSVLIHCVWLDDEDREIIQKSGAGVIVCPQSHFKLASGVAQTTEMLAQGIPVGIGTDGSASNNSLDLFREMDILAKSQKSRTLDATAMPAHAVLAAATETNAKILGLPGIGKIATGNSADLILLDLKQPHLQPFYNKDLLVYSGNGSDVHTVIVNGEMVVENKKLLSFDIQECMSRVRQLAAGV